MTTKLPIVGQEPKRKRQCGRCTMCCKVMGVGGSLNKAPGVQCQYCAPGKGCKIYNLRPEECKDFECLWLIDERWPESTRPDRCHVVMSTTLDGQRFVAHVDAARPDAYKEGDIGRLLQQAAAVVDVIVVTGHKRKLLSTSGRTVEVRKLIEGSQNLHEMDNRLNQSKSNVTLT